ncbi:chemotaxis protein CheW [Georgenia ruanii]|uniref:Chemotaxis protein CheW n=1 Tax=Georgenia ruanii TaxID=348442 RepID=A0A7J9UYM8_9MICO|nr:chemotaxis protein CheW [Georgenia ruanii]MPV89737.1 chemotaxis protein CheW [Georgenia ruanii]
MTQLVTFTLAGDHYAADVRRVREVVRAGALTPVPLTLPEVAGLTNLRGQILVCLDLRPLLALPAPEAGAAQMLLVVELAGEPVGLLVDDVGEVLDVDPAELRPPPSTLAAPLRGFITGAHPLPERLLLVLDFDALLVPDPSAPKEHP